MTPARVEHCPRGRSRVPAYPDPLRTAAQAPKLPAAAPGPDPAAEAVLRCRPRPGSKATGRAARTLRCETVLRRDHNAHIVKGSFAAFPDRFHDGYGLEPGKGLPPLFQCLQQRPRRDLGKGDHRLLGQAGRQQGDDCEYQYKRANVLHFDFFGTGFRSLSSSSGSPNPLFLNFSRSFWLPGSSVSDFSHSPRAFFLFEILK